MYAESRSHLRTSKSADFIVRYYWHSLVCSKGVASEEETPQEFALVSGPKSLYQ